MPSHELPPAYIDVLREVAQDRSLVSELRAAVSDLGDDGIRAAVFPMPAQWNADDYELFLADDRVLQAEFNRRVCSAIDDWHERNANPLQGLSPRERDNIVEWTRQQFKAELSAFSR